MSVLLAWKAVPDGLSHSLCTAFQAVVGRFVIPRTFSFHSYVRGYV